jgi:hypothetical protein
MGIWLNENITLCKNVYQKEDFCSIQDDCHWPNLTDRLLPSSLFPIKISNCLILRFQCNPRESCMNNVKRENKTGEIRYHNYVTNNYLFLNCNAFLNGR